MHRSFVVACLGMFVFLCFASNVDAQKCALKVRAWGSYPGETPEDGGSLGNRKTKIVGFTSTATNESTGRLYKGVSLTDHAYYENIPAGNYSIAVAKPGFKTSIQTHNLMCPYSADGPDFIDMVVYRGSSTQVIKDGQPISIPPRDPNRYTVKGDDFGSNQVNPPPAAPRTVPRRTISGGVLNGKAISLPPPVSPPAARTVRASGAVSVQVLVDEEGNVVSASAVGGHPLLRDAAVAAAREAKFAPARWVGEPVKVNGVITYNFVP